MSTLPVRFQIAALVLPQLAAAGEGPIQASDEALRYADALLQLLPHRKAPLVEQEVDEPMKDSL